MSTKRIAKNFFFLSSGQVISALVSFFVNIYLARVLTAQGYGLISFATAIFVYLTFIVDAGLASFGMREVAKYKEKAAEYGLNILVLRLLSAVIVYALSAVVVTLLPLSVQMKTLFLLTILMLVASAFSLDWVFKGLERMQFVSFSMMIQGALYLLLIVSFIRGFHDFLKVPLFLFISNFVASFFLFSAFLVQVPGIDPAAIHVKKWISYISQSIPMAAAYMLIQVYYNLDMIMLGFMKTSQVVGLYSAAYKFLYAGMMFLGLWQASSLPTVMRLYVADKNAARDFIVKYLRLTLLLTVPAATLAFALPRELVHVVFGAAYYGSVTAMRILIWNMVVVSINGIYGGFILFAANRQKDIMYGVGIGAVCNIILNFILIPPFSLVGAAVATLLTETVVIFTLYYWARTEFVVGWLTPLVKPAFSSLASFLCAYFVLGLFRVGDLVRLVGFSFVFAVVYLALIVLLGEWDFLLNFIRTIFRGAGEARA